MAAFLGPTGAGVGVGVFAGTGLGEGDAEGSGVATGVGVCTSMIPSSMNSCGCKSERAKKKTAMSSKAEKMIIIFLRIAVNRSFSLLNLFFFRKTKI
jgi:hypothetical protein